MFAKRFIAVAAASLFLAGQAFAGAAGASLEGVKGQVLVDQGSGFVRLANPSLNPGDRVVAMTGASARVRYADGCEIAVTSQALATIGARSPCAASSGLVRTSDPAQMDWAASSVIWLLVGLGLLAIVLSQSDSDDSPISP